MTRKYPKRRIVLFVVAFPWDLVCWFAVILIRLFWGKKLWWVEGSLWTELKPNSWPSRSWYRRKVDGKYVQNHAAVVDTRGPWHTWGGTTLGHGGFYGPGRVPTEELDTSLEFHEHAHVEQHEVGMLRGFLIGGAVFIVMVALGHSIAGAVTGGVTWFLGYIHMALPGWITAWFRGESAYRGSTHEEHARGVAKVEMDGR